MTRCLQLDVGNSSTKWRFLERGEIRTRGAFGEPDLQSKPQSTPQALAAMLACTEALEQIWVASVAAAPAEAKLQQLLVERWGIRPRFARAQAHTGQLRNSYAQPERMGADRWLAMLAAWERVGGPLCVVDAGSALTIDFVDTDAQHRGGYIIPGPALMERALLLDTDRVRFEEELDYRLEPGRSTAEAVRHGAALAQAGAVELALQRHGDAPVTLLLCGGGGAFLSAHLSRESTLAPDLVFEGLEIMAEYQQKPD